MHSLLYRTLTLHVLILLAVLAEWDVLLTCPKRWVDGEYTTLVCEIKRSSINNKCKNPGITAFRQKKRNNDTITRCAVSVNDHTYCNSTLIKSKCGCQQNATHFIYLYKFKLFGVSHEGNWSCKRQCNEAGEDHFAGDNPLVSKQSDGCFGVQIDYSTPAVEEEEESKNSSTPAVEEEEESKDSSTPAVEESKDSSTPAVEESKDSSTPAGEKKVKSKEASVAGAECTNVTPALLLACLSFLIMYFISHSLRRIQSAEDYFLEMPEHHQQYLPSFRDNLDVMRTCVAHNHEVIKAMLQDAEIIFENKNNAIVNGEEEPHIKPTAFDMDKVKTTIKQFVRDWSEAGRTERAACYDPVIVAVEKRFPPDTHNAQSVSILVPGAGLGRLAHEFARRGYSCQGNEWSLFMLIASNFVLNKCKDTNDFRLYPWVHQWSNNMKSSHQTDHITFPDVNPADLPDGVNFSMAAGDFLEVYTSPDVWDCVATVFFLDTAHNVVAYVEAIWKILKPGGYWVNLGPLLYHYSDVPGESSVELSYEDLRSIIKQIGFDFEEEKENIKSTYTQNPRSMLQYEYCCVYFVVRKPLDAPLS